MKAGPMTGSGLSSRVCVMERRSVSLPERVRWRATATGVLPMVLARRRATTDPKGADTDRTRNGRDAGTKAVGARTAGGVETPVLENPSVKKMEGRRAADADAAAASRTGVEQCGALGLKGEEEKKGLLSVAMGGGATEEVMGQRVGKTTKGTTGLGKRAARRKKTDCIL